MEPQKVIKVGGSLHDLPDLGRRLRSWLDMLPTRRVLLVCGGGDAADLVRQADVLDKLGEDRCHWLALRALTFMAHLLAGRLPGGQVIHCIEEREIVWQRGQTPILDLHAFTLADEARPGHLPHLWQITSDSLAARVAAITGSEELILLKSCEQPVLDNWEEAGRLGIVDAAFGAVVAQSRPPLHVTLVNFRCWTALDANAAPAPDRLP